MTDRESASVDLCRVERVALRAGDSLKTRDSRPERAELIRNVALRR